MIHKLINYHFGKIVRLSNYFCYLMITKHHLKKKLIILVILGSAIINCLAQPNPGFENWHTEFSYQIPDNWATLNFLSIFPPNALSAFKVSGLDKHSGNYALKLKTIFVKNNPAPGVNAIDDTSGYIFTGKINISPPSYEYGFPYSSRPEKLEFWYKYNPVGNDTGGVYVLLLKNNGIVSDTVAYGEMPITAVPVYTLFQFNIPYFLTAVPDTAVILFISSKRTSTARVGSALYLDDVSFSGWVGINEQDLNSDKVKTFPNPARDIVNIFAEIENADNVKIIDSSDRLAGIYKILNNHADINTGLFADGIYFYEIRDKKERPLAKGKFNVVK